ncbi:hypothetical protein BDQ17DRAFT_700787 [Cyathus striatus]|nr:hypothetical protein BDQ17DRAFT_700787 [Cyathus striatus]
MPNWFCQPARSSCITFQAAHDPEPETTYPDYNMLAQVIEATNSPSPLSRILQDPALSIPRPRRKKSERSSRSPRREHRSPLVVAMTLLEEERQANHLKALLRQACERIEQEMLKTDQALSRADSAETRALEATLKVTTLENAKRHAEGESMRRDCQVKEYEIRLDSLQKELRRAQDDIRKLEQQKRNAESSAERAKDSMTNLEMRLRDLKALEEGREEGRRLNIQRVFHDAHNEGWNEGYEQGYGEGKRDGKEQGLRRGRKEGLKEGKEQGRNEERRNALEAFDRFLTEEMGSYNDSSRRWAQSIYHPNSRPISQFSVTDSPRSTIQEF